MRAAMDEVDPHSLEDAAWVNPISLAATSYISPAATTTTAAPSTNAPSIKLGVKSVNGSVVRYRIRMCDPLGLLMSAYCNQHGLQDSQVQFMIHGEMVLPYDTAEKLGFEHDDILNPASAMPSEVPG